MTDAEILKKIKDYFSLDDTEDVKLSIMIENAKDNAFSYCNMSLYDTCLDNIVVRMVIEDYNKLNAEGLSSKSISGISESYINGYSQSIINSLNSKRKIKVLG